MKGNKWASDSLQPPPPSANPKTVFKWKTVFLRFHLVNFKVRSHKGNHRKVWSFRRKCKIEGVKFEIEIMEFLFNDPSHSVFLQCLNKKEQSFTSVERISCGAVDLLWEDFVEGLRRVIYEWKVFPEELIPARRANHFSLSLYLDTEWMRNIRTYTDMNKPR